MVPTFISSDFDDDSADERYIFFSRLGEGGMGETYRAWDKHQGRVVAIKRPKRSAVEKEGFLERFQRESRMMQQLQHPHIVPVTDVGTWGEVPYFAMWFLPGGSLSDRRLRDEYGALLPNPLGMLHFWLPGIAAALDYLHSMGMVHRDVKPSNIFFDAFGRPFLGDFGIAKVIDGAGGVEKEETLTGTHIALGTEFYMGPEMFAPASGLTVAIDQYALAVTVYELLVGRRPFTGETAHLIVEVTTRPAPRIDQCRQDLPASLVQAVHRGLAKRPQDRFASCTEFAQHVLAHVQHAEEEAGVVRFACPNCAHIIRISTRDAGRKGDCPRCRQRLVIAEDLSGLWTRSEQDRLSAHLAGMATTSDVESPVNDAADQAAFDFKPLSKPTRVPKPWLPKKYHLLVVNGVIAALCVIALTALVTVSPPSPSRAWVKNPDSRVVVDDNRLVVFAPKGFQRSSKSSKHLVEYMSQKSGGAWRIRVFAGDLTSGLTASTRVGDHPAKLGTRSAEKLAGVKEYVQSTVCSIEAGGRSYSVEVTAAVTQAQDAERLSKAIAGWLESPKEGPSKPLPVEQTGLRVDYFKGRNFEKKISYPDDIQTGEMNFSWLRGEPVNGLPADNFSIRWTGWFIPEWTGQQWFSGSRDDGLRIWIENELVVDKWGKPAGEFEGHRKYLYKDKRYPIKIEYYEARGDASLKLEVRGELGQRKILQQSQLRPAH